MARPSGSHVDAKKPPASCFDIAQLLLHPLVEARDIDHHALVGSPADRLLLVARLDLEAQPAASTPVSRAVATMRMPTGVAAW